MPLLDIAISYLSFQNNLDAIRPRILYGGTFIFGNGKRLGKSSSISEKASKINLRIIEMGRDGIVIKAVAALEPKHMIQSNEGLKDYRIDLRTPSVAEHPPVNGSAEVDDKEKLRRMRISQANKGNTPWNKGRKHNPETIQLIRERTRIAMQDPKVKMRLDKPAYTHSEETRIKIRVGVRIGWERRCKKLELQNACPIEWRNLIAEASRRGFVGEEELQWDSYKILDEQLEQEWLESVQLRKKMARPKGGKRAPKSPEQRRKISAAIAAKWADPVYRDRVYSGLSKYHSTSVGVGNKPRRRTNSGKQSRKTSPTGKKIANDSGDETKIKNKRARLKRSNMPLYKDPLASSKLEMLKNIRAQRAAAKNKKNEAIARAKLLIAEAENAAKALEISATSSPSAQAFLEETRKIIAEAIQSLESIKTGRIEPRDNGTPLTSSGLFSDVEKETKDNVEDVCQTYEQEVNGARTLASSERDMVDFGFGLFKLQELVDGKYEIDDDKILPTSSSDRGLVNGKAKLNPAGSIDYAASPITQPSGKLEPNRSDIRQSHGAKPPYGKEEERRSNSTTIITKKWVRGKLVEVAEGD